VGRVRFTSRRWKKVNLCILISERSSKIRHFLLGYAESSLGVAKSSLVMADSGLSYCFSVYTSV
jgi:hypothetical protein